MTLFFDHTLCILYINHCVYDYFSHFFEQFSIIFLWRIMALFVSIFVIICIILTQSRRDIIFESSMANVISTPGNLGWIVTENVANRCTDQLGRYCLESGRCLRMSGSCSIQRANPFSTINYKNIEISFLLVRHSNRLFETNEKISFQYSINGLNFIEFKSYENGDFTPNNQAGLYTDADKFIVAMPAAVNEQSSINIKIENTGIVIYIILYLYT